MSGEDIVCFTDGSCIGNGKTNPRGAYAVVWPEYKQLNQVKILEGPIQTNNRAEISALILAIDIMDSTLDINKEKTLVVYSDSMLLINTVMKWMDTWKKKDWKKSTGDQVMNLDLIKRIDQLKSKRKIILRHVKAHSKKTDWMSVHNSLADDMARSILL